MLRVLIHATNKGQGQKQKLRLSTKQRPMHRPDQDQHTQFNYKY